MGIVTFLVEAADAGLGSVAESQFAQLAEGMGMTIMLMSIIAMSLLFLNMAYQFRPMDGVDLLPLLFKIGLINAFATNWVNFNYFSGQIILEIDRLAAIVLGSISGETAGGATYFAARFDQQLAVLAEYGNEITSSMGRIGAGFMGVFITGMLALVGGLAAIVLILSKMMLTFLIGIAPIMIALSIFKVTQDYFHKWVAALVSWSIYPLVIAGTFSIIFGLGNRLQAEVGEADSIVQIGGAIPYLGVVILSLAMILAIPIIVRSLTGDINAGWAASVVGGAASRLLQAQPRRNQQARSQTVSPPRAAPEKAPNVGTGALMLQMQERAKRLRQVGDR